MFGIFHSHGWGGKMKEGRRKREEAKKEGRKRKF